MNNAGLPGTGLGGFLYILLALTMPFHELYLTMRGRSSRARWRIVAKQAAIACGMLGAVEASFWGLSHLFILGRPAVTIFGTPLPTWGIFMLAPLLVSLSLLIVLVLVLWAWALVNVRARSPRHVSLGEAGP